MSLISSLFGIWANGKTGCSIAPLFIRLLVGMAAVTVLSVIAALLTTILLIGGAWFLYLQFISYGIDPQVCVLILIGIFLVFLVLTVLIAGHYWQKVKNTSALILSTQTSHTGWVSNLVSSFLDGFFTKGPLQ